jgi:hypothetical protein
MAAFFGIESMLLAPPIPKYDLPSVTRLCLSGKKIPPVPRTFKLDGTVNSITK